MSAPPIVAVRDLSKRFGETWVLRGVDLTIEPGEIHGLLGHNGSGKSTLIKVLAGLHLPESGSVEINGVRMDLPIAVPQLREHCVRFVHQDLALIPSMTVAENFFSDDLVTSNALKFRRWRPRSRELRQIFRSFDVDVSPDALVADIPRLDRAQVALVRATLDFRTEGRGGLLVLDELTAFLPGAEVQELFKTMKTIAGRGAGILYVSHNLDEVLQVTDTVSVIRDGVLAGHVRTATSSVDDLVNMIVGHSLGQAKSVVDHEIGGSGSGTSVADLSGGAIHDVSFTIAPGEVLGVTGLIGSGFDQLSDLMFGVRSATAGTLGLAGRSLAIPRMTPGRAMDVGIAMVPSDRIADGSAPELSVADNFSLTTLDSCASRAYLKQGDIRRYADEALRAYDVRPQDTRVPFATLSGGNQQKVLLGKWLATKPRLLLINEPMQGVDVGTRELLTATIRHVARQGCGVLCASADIDQLVQVCTRVLIVAGGRIAAEVSGERLRKDVVTEGIYGAAFEKHTTPE